MKEKLTKEDRINQILATIKDPKERAEKLRILENFARLWQEPDSAQGITVQETAPLTDK